MLSACEDESSLIANVVNVQVQGPGVVSGYEGTPRLAITRGASLVPRDTPRSCEASFALGRDLANIAK